MSFKKYLQLFLSIPPDYRASKYLADKKWFQKAVRKAASLPNAILDKIAPDDEIEAITRMKQPLLEDKSNTKPDDKRQERHVDTRH
jgi:hypothetical protein